MEPNRPFLMKQVKCKNCGKIICEPFLQRFKFKYNNYRYHIRWCLCDDCIEKGVNEVHPTLQRDAVSFLNELAKIIVRYRVNPEDVFYKE